MDDIIKSEVSFFFMNYLSIMGDRLNKEAIDEISNKASRLRITKQKDYEKYLQELTHKCEKIAKQNERRLDPYLNGWTREALNAIQSSKNKVVIALCHHGEHRHILTDLAILKTPTICPIAGQSYFNYYNLNSQGTELITDYLGLTEVEEDKVSKQLIKSIRQGKVPAIYFDGNMGPENSVKFSNSVDVNFFNKIISVKAGIARIALLLKYSILPIFASYEKVNGKSVPKVALGEMIETSSSDTTIPNKDLRINSIMQRLYQQLEEKIVKQPEQWEYALCLHRWCKESNSDASKEKALDSLTSLQIEMQCLRLNESNCTVMQQKGLSCLVDVTKNKGYYPPRWAPQFFEKLASEEGITTSWIEKTANFNQDYIEESKDIIQKLQKENLVIKEFLAT